MNLLSLFNKWSINSESLKKIFSRVYFSHSALRNIQIRCYNFLINFLSSKNLKQPNCKFKLTIGTFVFIFFAVAVLRSTLL